MDPQREVVRIYFPASDFGLVSLPSLGRRNSPAPVHIGVLLISCSFV